MTSKKRIEIVRYCKKNHYFLSRPGGFTQLSAAQYQKLGANVRKEKIKIQADAKHGACRSWLKPHDFQNTRAGEDVTYDSLVRKLLSLTAVTEDPENLTLVAGFSLLSRVYIAAEEALPPLPVIIFPNVKVVPRILPLVVNIFSPPTYWEGKKWKLYQPRILEKTVTWDGSSSCACLKNYTSCTIRTKWKKKLSFSLPYISGPVLFSPALPSSVKAEFLTLSPMVLPIVLGDKLKIDSRPSVTFQCDGSKLFCLNEGLFTSLEKDSGDIADLIDNFVYEFYKDVNLQHDFKNYVVSNSGIHVHGEFTSSSDPSEVCRAAAVAIMCCLVEFALTTYPVVQADIVELLRSWYQNILPDRKTKKGIATSDFRLGDADNFWAFFTKFVEDNFAFIAGPGALCGKETAARFTDVNGERYLIVPRTKLYGHYRQYAVDHGGQDDETTDTNLQKTLAENGVPARSEKNNISWRYAFSSSGTRGGNAKSEACIGIRDVDLPKGILEMLNQKFSVQLEQEEM